jgi:dephospho-CoA kinase
MKIIGISGTNGSGKDTFGKILAERHHYLFISVTDIMRQELLSRGLPTGRENLRTLSAEWRREYGLAVLIDKAVAQFEQHASHDYNGLAVASLRNPGEADKIHELNGLVIWLDADPRLRYDRIQENSEQRGSLRAHEDRKTFQQFIEEEKAEMNYSGDKATLSMAGVKAKSDIFIENNDNTIDGLTIRSDEIISSF